MKWYPHIDRIRNVDLNSSDNLGNNFVNDDMDSDLDICE